MILGETSREVSDIILFFLSKHWRIVLVDEMPIKSKLMFNYSPREKQKISSCQKKGTKGEKGKHEKEKQLLGKQTACAYGRDSS